jgi:hypothetical protein
VHGVVFEAWFAWQAPFRQVSGAVHSVLAFEPQLEPLARLLSWVQVPDPLHSALVQSLPSVSVQLVPDATARQSPSCPALLHAWQSPAPPEQGLVVQALPLTVDPQADSQHTPSTQKFERHWLFALQLPLFGCLSKQAPPRQ